MERTLVSDIKQEGFEYLIICLVAEFLQYQRTYNDIDRSVRARRFITIKHSKPFLVYQRKDLVSELCRPGAFEHPFFTLCQPPKRIIKSNLMYIIFGKRHM